MNIHERSICRNKSLTHRPIIVFLAVDYDFFALLTLFCAVRRVRQTNYTNFRSLHKPRGVCRRHQRQERIKCHAERVKAACRDVFTMTPPPPPRYISSRRFSQLYHGSLRVRASSCGRSFHCSAAFYLFLLVRLCFFQI